MNDNIKEILDRLDFNEWEVDLYKVPITWCELYNIRDYITNLQTNWNSLRELIIKKLDKYDRLVSKEEGVEIEILMWIRDKMNELEGKVEK